MHYLGSGLGFNISKTTNAWIRTNTFLRLKSVFSPTFFDVTLFTSLNKISTYRQANGKPAYVHYVCIRRILMKFELQSIRMNCRYFIES